MSDTDTYPVATIFSPCRRYRYMLLREWDVLFKGEGYVAFIGLNPSTADETLDDPTIRRCKSFAKSLGFGSMVMLNLFAFRSTDPMAMKREVDPVGTENDKYLRRTALGAGRVIAAWGIHGAHLGRNAKVQELLSDVHIECFGKTDGGHPKHPLYLKSTSELIPLSA